MSRRAAGSAGRARPALLLVTALCVPGLLAVATADSAAGALGGGEGPVSSGAHRAAAGFTDLEYSVPFYGRLWSDYVKDRIDVSEAAATAGAMFFAEVAAAERDGSGLNLSFAVEGQSEAPKYEACNNGDAAAGTPGSTVCHDVTVRVTSSGLLYLYVPRNVEKLGHYYTHLGGFPHREVELSASDADSDLKVYREVMVGPSPAAAGCEDYPDDTPERYTCLFLRELRPTGQAGTTDATTLAVLRAGLPALVQDKANYRLVFAEEFNGVPGAGATTCSDPQDENRSYADGLSTLDDAVWNYYDACDIVDSKGEPCGNVGGGGLTMGIAGPCVSTLTNYHDSVLLNTFNHLHFKYGYVEFRYTFNLDEWPNLYSNLNLVIFTHGLKLRDLRDRYGVVIDDWEDFARTNEAEIDGFELVGRSEDSHQYANADGHYSTLGITPTRSNKPTDYCAGTAGRGIVANPEACENSDTFTVTRGIEWTPRGYRTFIKVDGIHNELTLLPKDEIQVQQMDENGSWIEVQGTRRDRYFEYLDPDDPGTLLEQVAVGHVPLPFGLSGWGWQEPDQHPYIRRRLTFDYLRVWQPENLYTDMEPVYQ